MLDETFAEAVAHKPSGFWSSLVGRARSLLAAESCAPPSGHVVLGQRLRQFSFWHAANLDFIESPYLGNKGTQDFAAMYLAAKCCQLRYPDTIASRKGFCQRLGQRRAAFLHARSILRNGTKAPAIEQAKFSAYLTDYFTTGPIHASKDGAKALKIPWYLYWVCWLVKYTGCTKAQAWDAPVSESQWWITGMAAAEGADVDILSAQDRADMKAAGIEI